MVVVRLLAVRALLAVVLWCVAAGVASGRESCPFLRDPAFWARTPVAAERGGEIAIATQNVYRFFDDENDRGERDVLTSAQFAARTQRLARYIARDLGAPSLVALQEVEDDTSLAALVAALSLETGRTYRAVVGAVSGNGDIRSALLLDARLRVLSQSSLFARTPRDGKPLHDRLPLVVDVDAGAQGRLTVVVVHMKSMRGMGKAGDDRVADKRVYQASELAAWARTQLGRGRPLIVLGDFNATPPQDSDATRSAPMQTLLRDSGLADPAGNFLKSSQRWTFRYGCALNQLDHILVAPALLPRVSAYAIARGDTCIRVKEKCDNTHSVSDHDGVVLRLR
jgi:predicted extracellular nuclease